MCFLRIPFSKFFKKNNVLGDDDDDESTPWYSHKSHGGYHASVCIDDRGATVVESLTCNDDDDDVVDDDDDDAYKVLLWNVDTIDFSMERASAPAPIVKDPLSHFDPDVLRVSRKALQLQVDQKKVELRNLGMAVPDDQTIFKGLDVWSSFGLINEALEKDPATSKRNHHRN